MLMASGLNHGIKHSLPHYLGICLGFPAMVTIVGFGMGSVVSRYPEIFWSIKVVGIIYLLYLAWKIANAGNPKTAKDTRAPLSFLQAVAFQWLNPKGWTIAIGALAAFTLEEQLVSSLLSIILTYLVMGFICMGVWLKLGHSLKNVLHTQKRAQYFNWLMALLLALSIIPLALSQI